MKQSMIENSELPIPGPGESKSFVNLQAVISKDTFFVTKQLAKTIVNTGYLSTGKFFKDIPNSDLDCILDKIQITTDFALDLDTRISRKSDLILLALVIAFGEGQPEIDNEKIPELMSRVMLLSYLTKFHRDNTGIAFFENFALTDSDNKVIFRPNSKEGEQDVKN
jgi:hypothetical protein